MFLYFSADGNVQYLKKSSLKASLCLTSTLFQSYLTCCGSFHQPHTGNRFTVFFVKEYSLVFLCVIYFSFCF